MEFNPEAILDELNDFEKRDQEVTPVLEEYLQKIAKTGNIIHPWSKLKPLLKRKMELVITDFCKSCPPDAIPSYPNTERFEYERLKTSILDAVDYFPSAPFTIQRLCELITNPKKHYNRTDKYMRGLEKNLLVVSTTEPGENDSASERDQAVANDWSHSDSSNEANNFAEAAAVSTTSPAVNGTVLENFASVFPTATRIANKANNIQVTIVTDTSAYHHSDTAEDLEYEVIDNSELKESEVPYEHSNNSSSSPIKIVISSVTSTSDGSEHLVKSETIEKEIQPLVQENTDAKSYGDENVALNESEISNGNVSKGNEAVEPVECDKNETMKEANIETESDNVEMNNEIISGTSKTSEGTNDNLPSDDVGMAKESDNVMAPDQNESMNELNEKMIEEMKVTTHSHGKDESSSESDVVNSTADVPSIVASDVTDCAGEPDAKRRKFGHDFYSDDNPNQESGDASSQGENPSIASSDVLSSEIVTSSGPSGDTSNFHTDKDMVDQEKEESGNNCVASESVTSTNT